MEVDPACADFGQHVDDFDGAELVAGWFAKGSRPTLPTVHRPKVKRFPGWGLYLLLILFSIFSGLVIIKNVSRRSAPPHPQPFSLREKGAYRLTSQI